MMSEQEVVEALSNTPQVHMLPELMVSYQTHVEVGDSKNAFVVGAAQLFCETELDHMNCDSGPSRTGETHAMHEETEERFNRRIVHLGNCKNCGCVGPSVVECRSKIVDH